MRSSRRRITGWGVSGRPIQPDLEPPVEEPTVGPSTPSGVSSAHRPVPGANAWPDDAVLLTYGELRRLIALHLVVINAGMPHDRPWVWIKARARAMEDGEAPLLLAEILSPPPAPGLPPR